MPNPVGCGISGECGEWFYTLGSINPQHTTHGWGQWHEPDGEEGVLCGRENMEIRGTFRKCAQCRPAAAT